MYFVNRVFHLQYVGNGFIIRSSCYVSCHRIPRLKFLRFAILHVCSFLKLASGILIQFKAEINERTGDLCLAKDVLSYLSTPLILSSTWYYLGRDVVSHHIYST